MERAIPHSKAAEEGFQKGKFYPFFARFFKALHALGLVLGLG